MADFYLNPNPFDPKPRIEPLTPEAAKDIRDKINAQPPEVQAKIDEHLARALGFPGLSGPKEFRSRAGNPKRR